MYLIYTYLKFKSFPFKTVGLIIGLLYLLQTYAEFDENIGCTKNKLKLTFTLLKIFLALNL